MHYSAAPRSPGKDFSGVPRTHQFLVTLMVHTNKTNATTAPTTASPTSVTDTDSVVAIPRDGQHQFLLCSRHHPDYQGKKPTRELIEQLHRLHIEREEAIHGNLDNVHLPIHGTEHHP